MIFEQKTTYDLMEEFEKKVLPARREGKAGLSARLVVAEYNDLFELLEVSVSRR